MGTKFTAAARTPCRAAATHKGSAVKPSARKPLPRSKLVCADRGARGCEMACLPLTPPQAPVAIAMWPFAVVEGKAGCMGSATPRAIKARSAGMSRVASSCVSAW